MDEDKEQLEQLKKIGGISLIVVVVIVILLFVQHQWNKKRDGTIVLPGGVTYLGPSPTPGGEGISVGGRFSVDENATWTTVRGNTYPYTMSVPESLPLVTFPDDAYDIKAVFWQNSPPQSNVLIGVDNLKNNPSKSALIGQSKRAYVEQWWRDFSGLTGVDAIDEFTNSKGMIGYKVKFTTSSGLSSYDDVFLEVESQPEIIIHLSNQILDPLVFDRIVDSVNWADTPASSSAQ